MTVRRGVEIPLGAVGVLPWAGPTASGAAAVLRLTTSPGRNESAATESPSAAAADAD